MTSEFPLCTLSDDHLNAAEDAAAELHAAEGQVMEWTPAEGVEESEQYLEASADAEKAHERYVEVVEAATVLLLIQEVKAWRAGHRPE